jgi:hypothetical protein
VLVIDINVKYVKPDGDAGYIWAVQCVSAQYTIMQCALILQYILTGTE